MAAVTDIASAKRYLYVYNSSGTLISQKNANMSNTSRGIDTGIATIGGEADGGETDNHTLKAPLTKLKSLHQPLVKHKF